MTMTARLDLPLIAPEQAQKHVTHNEALLLLDALVQLRLDGLAETAPPTEPDEGSVYGIGAGAVGQWTGRAGEVAIWTQGGWRFATPREGWLAWDRRSGRPVVWRGGAWRAFLQSVDGFGVGSEPDDINRLAVRSEAALFTAVPQGEGGNGNVRLTLNKESAADSATLIFQSGWSGRAEIGLAGDDDFAFKVSGDGGAWRTAMTLGRDTGFVTFGAFAGCAVSFPVVSAGVLAAQTGYVVPAPSSGTAAEVSTISGGFDGAVLIITGSAGQVLTFRDGAGNLKLGGDRVLDNFEDSLMARHRLDRAFLF